jgi:hypothetical protein
MMILSPLDKRRSIGLAEAARVLGIPPRTAAACRRGRGTRRISDRQAKVALAVPDRCSRRLVRTPRRRKKKRR